MADVDDLAQAGHQRREEMDPMSKLSWVVAGILQVLAIILAWGLWFFGALQAPGKFAPGTTGNVPMVVAFEICAAVVCLLVPGWLARRTRRPAWWLAGAIPALFALGTGVAVLTSVDL